MKNSGSNHVFIMAGGVGSRFWPKSRNNFPKQFIDILGIGKSLLQLTYNRFLRLCPPENIYIVTNAAYKTLVQEQLPGIPVENILCEPSRNNTAPCIAYATFKLAAADPDANMVVAPSDHFILYEDIFLENIKKGLETAEKQPYLITLGITPTRPDTGYGYIRYDRTGSEGVHKVLQFTEKPQLEKAKEFLASGEYVWNGGIFIWNVKTALQVFEKYTPDIFQLFEKGNTVYNTAAEQEFIDTEYPKSPNISIDYAIMEKADNVYTIPADFGWSDLGTWASLYEVAEKKEDNNVYGNASIHLENARNNIIHLPPGKLGVVKGLEDYIIVDDDNVLLIYPKSEEQKIKLITEKLKEQQQGKYL
ncbi:mannose-1-phosphate guanylyltransferase [Chitinophaga dinghuensis]|uniref:mannose-1-phosphate guanylyltransferase n=1 Tax=Chitinophaga dinghuensis TaxID=1539050 RepID=A0A327W778_9BACT|nr:mannose-1-phosphate guanylyltransferase [Chitinophaga dinghuensis]RAJ85821.1 mannose-1-phosphate guanylyltransferase [Chitinophaga dinghuensis]